MKDLAIFCGYWAGVLSILAYVPYIISIIRKKTKPSRASWIIWSLASFILLSSYFSGGAKETIWMPIAYAAGSTIIMLLSLRYGIGGYTKFDLVCFSASIISLGLWWYFKSPLPALLMNLAIDTIGSLPTIKKVYHEPQSEDRTGWILFFSGAIINFMALILGGNWNLEISAYPIVMFCTVGTISCLILFRKRTK